LILAFVTNWAFLSVNGLRLFFNSVILFSTVFKRFSFFSVGKKGKEYRLALWRVLALALALSDPTMCQPVCVSNLFL